MGNVANHSDATIAATCIVIDALAKTKQDEPGYYSSMLAQRSADCPQAAGSVYQLSTEQLDLRLPRCIWDEVPSHPAVTIPGVRIFKTFGLVGHEGMVNLSDYPADTVVSLIDPKATGRVSAAIHTESLGPTLGVTYALVGPDGLLWTFHPGEPVDPVQVEAPEGFGDGTTITSAEAIALGLTKAKRLYQPLVPVPTALPAAETQPEPVAV